MRISWEKNKPQKREIEKAVPVPIEQIMKDLSQGYSLTYPLEGRMAKKYKVYKKIGDVKFEVILLDHDIVAPQEPGASLMIYRDSKTDKLDGFSIMGRRQEGVGSYNFSVEETHPSTKPMKDFWSEYLSAEIDLEGKNKAIEADNKRMDAEIELSAPNLQLALGAAAEQGLEPQ